MSKKYCFIYKQIGSKIKKHRTLAGLSQGELAEELEVTRSSVANLESGKQQIYVHQICEIAEKCCADIAALLPSSAWIKSRVEDEELKQRVENSLSLKEGSSE